MLVTRPEPGLSETMARLAASGWCGIACPALNVESRPLRLSEARFDGVLVSSGQALPSLCGAVTPDLPLFAVGEATAARARAAGFRDVRAAEGDAAALLAALGPAPGGGGHLLLPTGEGVGQALAEGARRLGWRVTRRVAYVARPAATLAKDGLAALAAGRVEAVLFFSAATARAFRRALPPLLVRSLSDIHAIVLAPKIAAALDPAEWARISMAMRPHQDAMLECLARREDGDAVIRS
ncbi:uroporphyrinogen-III synthase [Acidomonas methanolica]|uniref:uroporphyrinogen-III synthase n=4 Tax=Acidomonas methanolica TaxID=437 RepID=UPI0010E60F91|nr:uroporphyrinogen-III synthase [Acidomonas methanolica]MBU2654626.1 uroporphyrinogen-III synthase [Acidomonas methanolica]TCS27499.1 uroporphyrinogen-III synthase [Acidomonas methanolica]GEK98594.1 hypothetical protein AME01nite_10930 [Acidomonas methanolica NBRC 104435]